MPFVVYFFFINHLYPFSHSSFVLSTACRTTCYHHGFKQTIITFLCPTRLLHQLSSTKKMPSKSE